MDCVYVCVCGWGGGGVFRGMLNKGGEGYGIDQKTLNEYLMQYEVQNYAVVIKAFMGQTDYPCFQTPFSRS